MQIFVPPLPQLTEWSITVDRMNLGVKGYTMFLLSGYGCALGEKVKPTARRSVDAVHTPATRAVDSASICTPATMCAIAFGAVVIPSHRNTQRLSSLHPNANQAFQARSVHHQPNASVVLAT